MIFFTDIPTDVSNYCLLHINKYDSPKKAAKKLIFVDPGVHYLMKHEEYPHIERLHELASGGLESNEWISIDYPGDMFPERMEEFIEHTYQNNLKYAYNLKYICTIQFHLSNCATPKEFWAGVAQGDQSDFISFQQEFTRHIPFFLFKNKILGIGNLCRIMYPTPLTDRIFDYVIKQSKGPSLFKNERLIKWVHIYGLSKRCIYKYVPMLEYAGIKVSVDSTKWTRVNGHLIPKYKVSHKDKPQQKLAPVPWEQGGIACTGETRPEFFLTYMKHLKKHIKTVEY